MMVTVKREGGNEMNKDQVEIIELDEEIDTSMIVQRGKDFQVAREAMPMEKLMEGAQMLAKSTIVPIQYQNRPENCFIAMDMASRMGMSVMLVMQHLYVIQGKPSFSGQAIASMVRANREFTNVELVYVGEKGKDSYGAYVKAIKRSTGKEVVGGTVYIATAKKEGWFQKNGSKWQTMPTQMLGYRAYTWFGRLHCPEVLMGLQSSDEVYDANGGAPTDKPSNPFEA